MEQVTIHAVAGVLKRGNKVLLATRPPNKIYAGHWEFPGGKLENNETVLSALIRELKEEVGIEVAHDECEYVTTIIQEYAHGRVVLNVVLVNNWLGDIMNVEGQQLLWHAINEECKAVPLLITTQRILDLIKKYCEHNF